MRLNYLTAWLVCSVATVLAQETSLAAVEKAFNDANVRRLKNRIMRH